MTQRPKTARAYASYLYMAGKNTGVIQAPMSDTATTEMRVSAFVDGVNWAKRQARKTKR